MRLSASIILCSLLACAVVVQGQDRRATAPRGGPGAVNIYAQVMHLRFTKAVTAPTPVGDTQDIRAHLESPVLGTVGGSTQKVVVLPSDIDVNLDVRLTSADPQRKNARLYLQITSANVDPAEGRRQFYSADVYHDIVGWPKPGDVLIPAGSTFSIPHFGGGGALSRVDPTTTDPNINRAEDSYPSHPILASSVLPIALVDQAIDVTNAGSNKLFRAQLTSDMEWMSGVNPLPVGAIKLTKGTELYVRSYEKDPSAPLGHIATWSVDFVVIDGKRIPVKGLELRMPFTPGSLAISPDGKRKIPVVMWPLGQTKRFNIFEQQEVFSNGTTLWTYPTTPDVAPVSAAPASTQSTSTPSVAPPSAAPATPTAAQQREENRKRAQEFAACQQQAITDHQADPAGLAQAIVACNPQRRR